MSRPISPIAAGQMGVPPLGYANLRQAQSRCYPVLIQADFPHLNSEFVSKVSGGLRSWIAHVKGLFDSTAGADDTASKESKRLTYEIGRCLGIKGFVLNLAGSASLATALPACWDAARPCLESPGLEDAAARILTEASSLAEALGETRHKSALRLSHDEASHLQSGLDFYHFLLPKMLVLSSALRLACDQELQKRGSVDAYAPEKKTIEADGLHDLFQKIREILSLSPVRGPVPALRVWSKYLTAASAHLKPVVQGENYNRASSRLHTLSRQSAPGLQNWIGSVELHNLEAIARQVGHLETLLPPLVISITLLELYFRPADRLAPARPAPSRPLPKASPAKVPNRQVIHQPVTGFPTAIPSPA